MHTPYLALIFFFYGLAFFSMGLAIVLEIGRASDPRLRHALRPLAAFGLIHAGNEWIEMFQGLHLLPGQAIASPIWDALRLMMLAFSFVSLGAFGSFLLAPSDRLRRLSLLVPLVQVAVWAFGAFILRSRFGFTQELWDVIDVWTRYVLGAPSALLACAGLIAQHRAFRRAGLVQFSRDSLWAAVAFAWYGLVGQTFVRASPLPPSTFFNQELFFRLFGFPIQLFRAGAAGIAAVFVIRFLRSFEVEARTQIAALQAARLQEAQRRESLRAELFKQVVAAQEAERQRMARELHDETGQSLTAIGLGLRGVTTMLRVDADKAAHNLGRLAGLVTGALTELQRLIGDLRPPHLDDLGLPAALRWYAGEVQNRTCLPIRVEVIGEPGPIAPPVTIALFRIVQEALTNVVRHAEAKSVGVSLRFEDGTVGAVVQDDGRGFDMEQAARAARPCWGLLGMQERASLLGGSLIVESRPGAGTRVEVRIPDPERTQGNHDHSSAAGG